MKYERMYDPTTREKGWGEKHVSQPWAPSWLGGSPRETITFTPDIGNPRIQERFLPNGLPQVGGEPRFPGWEIGPLRK